MVLLIIPTEGRICCVDNDKRGRESRSLERIRGIHTGRAIKGLRWNGGYILGHGVSHDIICLSTNSTTTTYVL